MNKRFVGVLIFAFVVASGASLLLYRLLLNRPQQAKAARRGRRSSWRSATSRWERS